MLRLGEKVLRAAVRFFFAVACLTSTPCLILVPVESQSKYDNYFPQHLIHSITWLL